MHYLRRIAVVTGVVVFLLCCATFLLYSHTAFGWQALSIPTDGTRPAIVPGSLVLVHRVPESTLRAGDVITYTNPLTMHTTLTRRIIKVYKSHGVIPTYITKGDASPSSNSPIAAGLVQGKEIWQVPHVGAVLMWAKTRMGTVVLLYLPALIFIAEGARRMANYHRQMRPYHLLRESDDYEEPTWLLLWRKPAGGSGTRAAHELSKPKRYGLLLR